MKILGISCGRPMGNSEILLKEALMATEAEYGADVEFLRLNDFEIRPCTGCGACRGRADIGHGISDCIYDDDFPLLVDHLLDADGVIVAAPIYIWAPSGNIRVLADRLGPTYDVELLKSRGMDKPESPYDKRIFKDRVGAFITVGGTTNPKYASMGMGPMRQFAHSLRWQIVDQLMVLDSTLQGQCLKHPDKIQAAYNLGKHVAQSVGIPEAELEWLGEEEGTCPVCHNNMLMIDNGSDKVKCPFCIVEGKVCVAEDGTLSVDFSEADLTSARQTSKEMLSHGDEISIQLKNFQENKKEWLANLPKYRNLDIPITKPETSKWKISR